jgi:23S rRNA pseudouridine1911/1915/1917 synthase
MILRSDLDGERLDAAIARLSGTVSRSAAQRLAEEGAVLVDGAARKKNYKLRVGETIELTLPEAQPIEAAAEDIPLDVVYEDDDLIVINKPKGLVVHPAAGHWTGTLVNALIHHCGDSLSGVGGKLRPGIVHRIDKDTSGLIIAAKNDFAHRALAAQLADHTLARTYRCIAVGSFREDAGTIDLPIGRHPTDRKKMAVNAPNAKPAVTHWRVLERFRGYSYLECNLETGRTHQIRVHLAAKGHPILGDTVYGKAALGMDSQCLHAVSLRFIHPRSGDTITLSCPEPEDWAPLFEKLRRM